MRFFNIYIASLFISISLLFLILYANLFSLGYSFLDYVHFISRKLEVQLIWIGFFLLFKSLKKKGNNNEIFKRRIAKFR